MTEFSGGGDSARARALRAYGILNTPPEAEFDDLAALAARTCGASMAEIGFADDSRWWVKATWGPRRGSPAPGPSYFDLVIAEPGDLLEIRDASTDPRGQNPAGGAPAAPARFIAGAALVSPAGVPLGALFVMDPEPCELDEDRRRALRAVARQTVVLLENRRCSARLKEETEHRERAEAGLRDQNEQLVESQREASRLLELAEKSRGALLSIIEDEQRTGKALTRSNRALKMLSTCNEALIGARDEGVLLTEVCRIAVELGGHDMAFVAYVDEGAGKGLTPLGRWGDDTGYLDEISLSWDETTPAGRGPAGRCIREGAPMVCQNLRATEWSCQHIEATERRGYHAVVCLPLRDAERTFGLLGLYSKEVRNMEAAEVRLLKELADDIALGVTALRSRRVRERTEAALLSSLREKEALLKEVHHRVKNNLQVIASLLRLEGRRIDHPITQSVLVEMQNRIQSMALLHESLYRSGNFATVDLAGYLTQLLRQMFRSLAAGGGVSLRLELAPAQLEIDQAIPCGLIVNELASNALKHGFPPGRSGEVTVRLVRRDDGLLCLTVSDDGVGLRPDFDPATNGSLGLQLVTDLARQIHGSLAIGPGPRAVFEVLFNPGGAAAAVSPSPLPAPEPAATRSST